MTEREELQSPELFANRVAFVLHNVLSRDECAAIIEAAQTVGFKPATIKTGFKTIEYQSDFRVGDNCYLWNADIRQMLFERIRAHLPTEFRFGQLMGLNERLTVLRYRPGGFFGEHTDGTCITPDNSAISFITVQLYLNDGFEGGETTFFPDGLMRAGDKAEDRRRVAVTPRAGSAVVFEHKILHEGSLLKSGEKFTLRADVMFSRYFPSAPANGTQVEEAFKPAPDLLSKSFTETRDSTFWSRCAIQ